MAPVAPILRGRNREREALARLVEAVLRGESAVLVVRGEAGIGKTALIQECLREAENCRVAEIAGVESELDLPFAALHQLCAPLLFALPAIPEPQQRALQIAFGLTTGTTPDRFHVGLAVLSLLAEVASKEPLVCVFDDAQWLDDPSSQVLAFVGRRLMAESVAMIFAVRERGERSAFGGFPDLTLEGVADEDARALLADSIPGQLNEHVRDRIIAETRGNPLGLLELPRGMTRAELAGGFAVPATSTVSAQIEASYQARVKALPGATQLLMLVAAADPTADAALLFRAAGGLGIGRDAAVAATADDLVEIGSQVRFRHPLVRTAAYGAAAPEDRARAHTALAEATDPENDPERRAWHLAAAATGFDEELASELERTAGMAQTRAGLAAAAEFLTRAAELTSDPARRADRALSAAEAQLHAGTFDTAQRLLADVAAIAVDDLQRARVEQLAGEIEAAADPGREAPIPLLRAARRLESLDVSLARETYLQAWWAAVFAGRLAAPGADLVAISLAACSAPHAADPRPCDLLLDGLATVVTDGRMAAAPSLRQAVDLFLADQVSTDDWIRWGRSATTAAFTLWDIESWAELSSRQVTRVRSSGALAPLALALNLHAFMTTCCGDLAAAEALVAEQETVKEVTRTRMASYGALLLAAYQGRPTDLARWTVAINDDRIVQIGQGYALELADLATAVLNNGLGRYAAALAAAQAAAYEFSFVAPFALSELIEAAVRTGSPEPAEDALRQLSTLIVDDSDWAAGIEARGRALVTTSDDAERWYRESIACVARTRLRPELARSHLLYGEWLRRENRRVDARERLRTAHDIFQEIGAEAFAERTRRELAATGERVRKRDQGTPYELTAQETHIARLVQDGRTNREIGAELFLSARTVEWHLGHVFAKLGINSRRELKDALQTVNR